MIITRAKWIDYNEDEQRALIANAASAKNIDPVAVEKDWWVTAVLYAVFHSSIKNYALFKGGTSLSKAWNIISRFSEDVDIALDRTYYLDVKHWRCATCANNTQIRNLKEMSQDFLFGEYKDELSGMLVEMGLDMVEVVDENEMRLRQGISGTVSHDKDPSVLYVRYPSIFSTEKPYALPVVKIEISCLSMREPYEVKPVSSLVEQINSLMFGEGVDNDFSQEIKTVSPARTFLEKAFLLAEEFMKDRPRTNRMSRHLYDIEKLSHTKYMSMALADHDLYMQIVRHRKKYYHLGYVDYDKILPDAIDFVPPARVIDSFRSDYNEMTGSFIYEESSLDFDSLLQRIAAIRELFSRKQ